MKTTPFTFRHTVMMSILAMSSVAQAAPLDGSAALEMTGDLAEQMVDGIHQNLDRQIDAAREGRATRWQQSAHDGAFVAERRLELQTLLGAVDERLPVAMETSGPPGASGPVATASGYNILPVRWPVFESVMAEGYLVEPTADVVASLIVLPDADERPESLLGIQGEANPASTALLQFAEAGCRVLVMALVDRSDTWSGHPEVRMTNQPHREFIYRGAYEMGRHVVGYEVQSARAGLDWLKAEGPELPVGILGYGEGALIALATSALDTRLTATVVSGYFGPHDGLWQEPIYRNIWSRLVNFGDAEMAALVAPRTLIVENAAAPNVTGPPTTAGRPQGAAPGVIPQISAEAFQREVERATATQPNPPESPWIRQTGEDGGAAFQAETMAALANALGLSLDGDTPAAPQALRALPDADARMKRLVTGWLRHTKHIMEEGQIARKALWNKADGSSVDTWVKSTAWYRDYFHEEIIGKLSEPLVPARPRTRQVYETEAFTGYEVVLDVYTDVFAYGILLVPKDIPEGERRPVVVCQHGLEGRPQEVTDPAINSPYYEQYGCRLAERGFIVYAPQNPYIGGDHFRSLQRKANPLGLSLFSYIVAQHQRTLEWLASLPNVDGERIAFYGLSYGGKTAMRVPAILEEYCLSICSGDYDEWIWKNVTTRQIYSYMFHGEYEMFEWNLGNTFNYAEMSWLICPRPFMVERGHGDGVAPDEWVGYEYARTQHRYDLLGIGDATTIEYFDGPHKINGVGTFAFLHDKLNFPAPGSP